MNFYLKVLLGMGLVFGFTSPSLAEDPSPAQLVQQEPFAWRWKLPQEFSAERIADLLTLFSQETYQTGFRYIGDRADFFHGHILFTSDDLTPEGRLRPFAILYHTQEDAYAAHWGEQTNEKYDYLNVQTRNWLQWLSFGTEDDGQKIENARDYLASSSLKLAAFSENLTPKLNEHFTIASKNLDPQKLGYTIFGELEFDFFELPCTENRTPSPYELGPITVIMPDGQKTCLMLTTASTGFFQFSK